jgi:hypothetical protein
MKDSPLRVIGVAFFGLLLFLTGFLIGGHSTESARAKALAPQPAASFDSVPVGFTGKKEMQQYAPSPSSSSGLQPCTTQDCAFHVRINYSGMDAACNKTTYNNCIQIGSTTVKQDPDLCDANSYKCTEDASVVLEWNSK